MSFTMAKPLEFLGHVPKRPSPIPHFFSMQSGTQLASILTLPYNNFIEISPHEKLERLLESPDDDAPDISLSITTESAYRYPAARPVTEALNQRFGLQGHKSLQLETCVHEALLNAVIHGNLGMQSMFDSWDGMDAFYLQLEKYLRMDRYRFRRVQLRAWDASHHLKVAVTDEGAGFALMGDISDSGLPHGRGLHFIRSLADHTWIGEDRRTLFMTFTY